MLKVTRTILGIRNGESGMKSVRRKAGNFYLDMQNTGCRLPVICNYILVEGSY